MDSNEWSDLLNFMKEVWPFEKQELLRRDTRLQSDMGIYGDDAMEIMNRFSAHFNVSIEDFDYNKYFSSSPNSFLSSFLQLLRLVPDTKRIELTLGDLERFIQIGVAE